MIRNKKINNAINSIKIDITDAVKNKYVKNTNKGRPNALSLDETLNAFFLCFTLWSSLVLGFYND